METTIITSGESAAGKAEKIENYYGFPNGVSGAELYKNGLKQANALGVKIISDEVFSIGFDGEYTAETKSGKYKADGIIIATGGKRQAPAVKGLKEFEGRGVSYCAVCDAFFFKGKDVAVLGCGDYALHETKDLINIVNSITVLTDGEKASAVFPEGVNIITEPLAEVRGEARLRDIVFSSGRSLKTDGLFVACGTADSTALAKKIGAVCENGKIRVDGNMKTTVKNVYAAGDCTGGLLQISKAVYEGAKAATELIKSLRRDI